MESKSAIIFLLGFMGSGKTKTGSRAAKLLGYDFIDLDKYIQQREGKTIEEIFKDRGEEYFREKEEEYLRELIGTIEQPLNSTVPAESPSPLFQRKGALRNNSTIISVGGGTPCYHNNMAWMLQHGKCIWLKVSEEELFERLKDKREKRPLLQDLTDEGLKEFIRNRLAEREKYYSQAQLIIKADGLKAKELVEKISQLK